MRRILLLGMAVLLELVALPSYGQVDPDEVFTIFEWDFANGQGDFTTMQDVDMMYEGDASQLPRVWQYDDERKCMVASFQHSSIFYAELRSPSIDLTDKFYYDVKLSFEYSTSDGYDVYWNTYINAFSKSGNNTTWVNDIKLYEGEKNIDKLVGGMLSFWVALNYNDLRGKLYIKKFKITGKHKYGRVPFTKVGTISAIKELAEKTPVAYCNSNLVVLSDESSPIFVRDETGAMMLDDGFYAYSGRIVSDTIYGIYTREHGVTELKNTSVTLTGDEYDETGRAARKVISEDDYWDNECEYVEMPISEAVYVVDTLNIWGNGNIEWYVPHNDNTIIRGFVYPTPDHKKRFIWSSWGCGMTVYLPESGTNVFTQQDVDNNMRYCIERPLEKDKWYTLTLPGSTWYISSSNCTLAEFVSSDDGTLVFQTVNSLVPGKPYLVKPKNNLSKIEGYITLNDATPQTVNGGDYNFVGTLNPTQPADGTYYLSANNTIKPLASGGTINAFRGYFEPASPNAAKARAISIDGMTTAIEDIVGGEELLGLPQKIYTVGGQYVGDDLNALPKGVYLVNGKKIIK